MVLEDFKTYTESDAGGYITVTDTSLTATNMIKNTESYVKKDYGGSHFGDFTHNMTLVFTSADDTCDIGLWMLSSDNTTRTIDEALVNNEAFGIHLLQIVGDPRIQLKEYVSDSVDTWSTGALPKTYYLTIARASTTATVKIYSDAARATLVKTLTLTVPSTKYQYLIAMSSREAIGDQKVTCTVQDLDLQEPVAAPGDIIFRRPAVRANPLSNI